MATNDERQQAQAQSDSNREQVGYFKRPITPELQLERKVMGGQPLGIASQVLDSTHAKVVFASYFHPALCILHLELTPNDPRNAAKYKVEWVRGVQYGDKSRRIFPDFFDDDHNRAHCVNFGPDNTLWVTRNGDREIFEIMPPPPGQDKWLPGGRIVFPGPDGEKRMIHSCLRSGNHVYTIESPWSLRDWTLRKYEHFRSQTGEQGLREIVGDVFPAPLLDYVYGLALEAGTNESFLCITDVRSPELPGIYRFQGGSWRCALFGLTGNGLCLLPDGSLITTYYGESSPDPLGSPGALYLVPSEKISKR